MANRDSPMGFRPVKHLLNSPIKVSRYQLPSGYSEAIYTGDLVLRDSSTRRVIVDVSGGIGAGTILGSFAGVRYRDTDGAMQFRKSWVDSTVTLGSEDAEVYVYDDPFIIYEVQADTAMPLADIGTLVDVVYAAGSHLTGYSACTVGAAGGADLLVYDVKRSEDNELDAANNKLLVMINTHTYRNAGAASFASV